MYLFLNLKEPNKEVATELCLKQYFSLIFHCFLHAFPSVFVHISALFLHRLWLRLNYETQMWFCVEQQQEKRSCTNTRVAKWLCKQDRLVISAQPSWCIWQQMPLLPLEPPLKVSVGSPPLQSLLANSPGGRRRRKTSCFVALDELLNQGTNLLDDKAWTLLIWEFQLSRHGFF